MKVLTRFVVFFFCNAEDGGEVIEVISIPPLQNKPSGFECEKPGT
jgi:hypothetical protein